MAEVTYRTTVEIPDGEPGKDQDPDHPMARALRVPMKEGAPQQAVAPVLFSGPEESPLYRWLGALVLTPGDRLLFFPYETAVGTIEVKYANGPKAEDAGRFDHFSLSPDRESWHATSHPTTDANEKEHPGISAKTLNLGSGRRLWFGMGVQRDLLSPVYQRTVIEAEIPEKARNHIEERAKQLQQAAERGNRLEGGVPVQGSGERYPYFALVVGAPGFELDREELHLPVPYRTQQKLFGEKGAWFRARSVRLGEEIQVQIWSSMLPGPLENRAYLSCGEPLVRLGSK